MVTSGLHGHRPVKVTASDVKVTTSGIHRHWSVKVTTSGVHCLLAHDGTVEVIHAGPRPAVITCEGEALRRSVVLGWRQRSIEGGRGRGWRVGTVVFHPLRLLITGPIRGARRRRFVLPAVHVVRGSGVANPGVPRGLRRRRG